MQTQKLILPLLSFAFLAASSHALAAPAAIHLDAHTTIVVDPQEPQPVRLAAQDLASDFDKVFGARPTIADVAPSTAGSVILIGQAANLPDAMRPAHLDGPESFSIAAAPETKTIVLAGADMRGTLYAIYQFSQDELGVDPMYYWTDRQPPRRTSLSISATFSRTWPAPVFKYRGFFLNDEDLLSGWAPGDSEHTGIALAVMNKVYETILRLKGNMVVPGTWIFPDDPRIRLAGERGLIVTQHHAIPLGLNVARWPRDVPYNYTTHPEILERAWKDAVAEYPPGQEILWAVGLRGLSDVSYASMDPSVRDNDKALGALISKAIRDQMRIVRAVHPDAHFVTDLWQEGARLEQEGYLSIPPEVTPVWADDGSGFLQDKGEVRAGEGMYYHVAMLNGRANQLSEMVPVERIVSELGRYIHAGATQYLLLNTSDIRPVSMTARAVMEIAWQGHLPSAGNATENVAPGSAAADYYRYWAAQEFGSRAAPAVAAVYKDYFGAPATYGDPPHQVGDQYYHDLARQMSLTYMIDSPLYAIPSQSPKWEIPRLVGAPYGWFGGKEWLSSMIDRAIDQCMAAQPRWDAVWAKALAAEPLVAPSRRPFYQAEVLTMIAINRQSNRMLALLAESMRDEKAGKTAEAQQEAAGALAAVTAALAAESAAEYGKWKNWYRGDWLTGLHLTQQTLQGYVAFLKDPLTPLAPPILWNGWEGYYHIMHFEGDRSADVQ